MEKCKNKVLLSFILPVYNVEAYLRECVESILQQITDQCEIILVNDGSTDTSGEICQGYADACPLISLVEKENGGLSSARNAGLAVARGEYITFVDSDDKIFPNTVAAILKWIESEGADLCFLQSVKLYSDGSQVNMGEEIAREQLHLRKCEDAVRYLASRPKYPGSAWGKLYRREFLLNNDLHFPYDCRYSEDLGFLRDCILQAHSMDALEISYYQYRQGRSGSITSKISTKNFYDLLRFITESVEKLTDDRKPKDMLSNYAMGFVAYEYAVLLYLYNAIVPADKEDAMKKLKEYRWTLMFSRTIKGRMLALLSGIFGLEFATYFMVQYRKANCK